MNPGPKATGDLATQPSGPAQSVAIFPILLVNFIGTLGFSIVLPFLVFLVTRWGGNAFVYGIVGATYSACQLVGAPLLGRWSDVYGRRRILLLSQAGTFISWCVFLTAFFAPSHSLWTGGGFVLTLPLLLLFIARAADGITGGNISVANAYLADITAEKDRSANFGKLAVSSNLGFVLGPAIAGILTSTLLGEMLPVLVALLISLVATLVIAFKLPESKPCATQDIPKSSGIRRIFGQEQKSCYEETTTETRKWTDILRLQHVPFLLAIHFLIMLGFNFFYIAFPVHASGSLGWSVTETGIFFSVLSLLMVLVQGPLLGRLSGRLSDGFLASAGSLILASSFLFYLSRATSWIYVGAAFLALGNGIMWPSVIAILSRAAGTKHQGAVQGVAGSSGAVASILGLVIGGLLYGVLEARVFLLSAAMITIVFLASLRFARMKTSHEPIAVS